MATCYRHPTRETAVSCSSCGRPICPDCMTTTPVGMRCPDCARQRTKVVRMRELATVPRVTYALIAINVLAFLTEQGQFTIFGASTHGKVIEEGVLWRYGVGVQHQYWRLVTSGFLHENILHIGFNMYLLYLLGTMLEPAIGSPRFATIYFTSLLVGSFGALLATASPSLGASGAIFGLMGAAVIELRSRRMSVMESGIGGLIILNLILSFSIANISVGAHIGGLIGGGLAALAIRTADERKLPALGYAACAVLSVAAVAGSLAVSQATGTGFV
ncbi:MAG TPA: rhomboid family intramembrane serine protease [Solirubrobacteraceae bacterium]|jgi:membrane associated rhomboid family serine protease|nr:rhomboid family intramembrane serine protease [Solirubrobacteraceae bacterium]